MRKLITISIIWALIGVMSLPMMALAEERVVGPSDLAEVETVLFGQAQTGPLLERLERAEREVYGETRPGSAFLVRLQRLVNLLVGGDSQLNLKMKLNVIEWAIFSEINEGPAITERLDHMEVAMFGEVKTGMGFNDRVNELMEMMWPGGRVHVGEEVIPEGTLVKVKLLTDLNSEVSQEGDVVQYVVMNDVKINEKITIAAGAVGEGRIIDVHSAGRLGRDGRVQVDFGSVAAIDSTRVSMQVDSRASERNKNMELAAGASVVGAAVLGPLGLAAGLFVTGQESVIPAGSEFYVEVANEVTVHALSLVPLN